MRKLFVLAAVLTATSAMAADLTPTSANCSISNINKIAMNEGLAKATTLSKNCIAKGYTASKKWLGEKTASGAETAKDAGSASWDFMKEKGAAAKDVASDLADKGLEKAAALKDKLFK
ncbi:MAG: hypothetical protein J6V64_01705 [Burkholderiaceae bacterium]|nr:hypothetical protein [Burkholderiaceae bacterium]